MIEAPAIESIDAEEPGQQKKGKNSSLVTSFPAGFVQQELLYLLACSCKVRLGCTYTYSQLLSYAHMGEVVDYIEIEYEAVVLGQLVDYLEEFLLSKLCPLARAGVFVLFCYT